jgi:peptide/nickel transport system permease protein
VSTPALEEQFEPGAADSVEVARARSSWELFRRRFRQDKAAMAGAVAIIVLVLLALTAPLFAKLTGHGPNDRFPDQMLTADIGLPKGPNKDFWFGGDSVGRDVFVRTLYGARTSLAVALIATGLAALIGISLGMIAGYRGGKTDTFISRLVDIVLSLPVLLLAIGVASVCSISPNGCLGGLLQPGLSLVVVIITLFTWPNLARLVRGQAIGLREREFVEAARVAGASSSRIIFRHILPNTIGVITVSATLTMSVTILLETSLSFLGLGVHAPDVSLGQLIEAYQTAFTTRPWLFWWPGLFIIIIALSINFIGDGLRDAFDPRQKRALNRKARAAQNDRRPAVVGTEQA